MVDLIKNDVVCILLKCFCNPSVGVEYGGVRVQGMCPHEFYLGTCTCIFFLKNQVKGCGCGCGVWGCQGARDVST